MRRRRDVQAGLRGIVRDRDVGRFGTGSLRDASPQSRLELGGETWPVLLSKLHQDTDVVEDPRFGNDMVPVQTPSVDVPLKKPFRERES